MNSYLTDLQKLILNTRELHKKNRLRESVVELKAALAAFASCPNDETLRALNGAWARTSYVQLHLNDPNSLAVDKGSLAPLSELNREQGLLDA